MPCPLRFMVGALTPRSPGRLRIVSFRVLMLSVQQLWGNFYWILMCLFVSLVLLTQNWSSLRQETSSTPWRHPALTSCWGGKAETLLWARSRSAQRRAPLFLESRPRGGDWSGLYFETRFSSTRLCPRWRVSLVALTWPQLSQTVNVAFSVQNKHLHMPFSHKACSTKTPRPSLLVF